MPNTIKKSITTLQILTEEIAKYIPQTTFDWKVDVWFEDAEAIVVLFCISELSWTYIKNPTEFITTLGLMDFNNIKDFETWNVEAGKFGHISECG